MKNRPLFHADERAILERAVNTLTLACEALEVSNRQCFKENERLTAELRAIKAKQITND